MVSLNDVLLAMSDIPVDDPIAEIWGRGLQGGYEIIEYTGTLPITIIADGNALLDYRIYGNTVQDATPTPENPIVPIGCGVRTENLFDKNATDTANGYVDGEHLRNNGATNSNSLWAITEYIPITGGNNYTFDYGSSSSSPAICYYDSSKQFIQGISYGGQKPKTVSIPSNVSYIRFSFMKSYADTIMIVQANSLPETYVPYGYKLPMTISDGNTVQTVPIYIGENQLDASEYASYSDGKIYRIINGTLTPTDPPVPLPEIPTFAGTTIIDYDGEPKPSQMYINIGGKLCR